MATKRLSTDTFGCFDVVRFVRESIKANTEPIKQLWLKNKYAGFSGDWDGAYSMFEAAFLAHIMRSFSQEVTGREYLYVVEVGPNEGWTTAIMTLWAQEAENSILRLTSFDLQDKIKYRLCSERFNLQWQFVGGDFRKTSRDHLDRIRQADIVFFDADHSREFAEWYLYDLKVFDLMKPGALFHAHDVMPPGEAGPEQQEGEVIWEFLNRPENKDQFDRLYVGDFEQNVFPPHPHPMVAPNPSLWLRRRE